MLRFLSLFLTTAALLAAADPYHYNSGFGSHFSSEAIPNTLPIGQNTPQVCPKGLYAEQLSGSAFTAPRGHNKRTWLYRIRPLVSQGEYEPIDQGELWSNFSESYSDPTPLKWVPLQIPIEPTTFLQGLSTVAGVGSPDLKTGLAIHRYAANRSMDHQAFYNADGEMLLVPEKGALDIQTEMGKLWVEPGEIAVLPRGVRFAVRLGRTEARGYIWEIFESSFSLPERGPIGANGLANERDFLYPQSFFDRGEEPFEVIAKFQGKLFKTKLPFSPFNVVAFHGNYLPYKYDLSRFNTVNSVSYDHLDPSIFTVLTAPSLQPGVAVCDFVIFPPRWSVAENTFRPPYYHRNCMSEFMGLIKGVYEAKLDGFLPGGATLHSVMTPHGPDAKSFKEWSEMELKPMKVQQETLAFMFESTYLLKLAPHAVMVGKTDPDYLSCWDGLEANFSEEAMTAEAEPNQQHREPHY